MSTMSEPSDMIIPMLQAIREDLTELRAGVRQQGQRLAALERQTLAVERAIVGIHEDIVNLHARLGDMETRLAQRIDRLGHAAGMVG
jgi:hypothetical protein